jgi:heme/copper-type cytochrome/quinol oxidase subunit 3
MKTTNKEYRKDLWLFIASVVVLLYILFMNYAYVNQLENVFMRGIMELVTIPMIILGSVVPVIVVYRHITKKTQSRTLSMLAVLFSLVTAILIGYTSF